jgi:hypothetical protein
LAEQGEWASSWLAQHGVNLSALQRGTTYVVEIVYRENLVVVRYYKDREGVFLCAAYDRGGRELARDELEAASASSMLPLVPLLASGRCDTEDGRDSLRSTIDAAIGAVGRECEGCVVRFALRGGRGCHRVKVKSRDYQKLFKLQDSLTPRKALEVVRGGIEALAKAEAEVPQEFSM